MVATIIVIFLLIELVALCYWSLDKRLKELEKSVQELDVEEDKFKEYRGANGLFTNRRK